MEAGILHRRDSLILTAIDVIDELGIQGLSIREVAQRQGITTAAIFSHFKSKNDLILAVLDHYIQYDSVIEQAIQIKGFHSKEAIIYYLDSFYTYYENYPAITALLSSYEGLRCKPEFSEKVKNILFKRNLYIQNLVKEAQDSNDLRSDIDRECIADVILGSCTMVCLKWRMVHLGFPLKERILYTVNAILDSFTPN